MKQVKLIIAKAGRVRILAHGTYGQGTAQFTESLARDLGEIVERHQGTHHTHNEAENKAEIHQ